MTITLSHAGKPAETIGTATPDAAGAFTAEIKARVTRRGRRGEGDAAALRRLRAERDGDGRLTVSMAYARA